MLFFPKYGTIGVCAEATRANPAPSRRTRAANANGANEGIGTRGRIGGTSERETRIDLTVDARRLQTACSTISPLLCVRRRPRPPDGPALSSPDAAAAPFLRQVY